MNFFFRRDRIIGNSLDSWSWNVGSSPAFAINYLIMIHIQTKLKIKDNTGVKIGQCIKIYKKSVGTIGDNILISVKNLRLNKIKKIFRHI